MRSRMLSDQQSVAVDAPTSTPTLTANKKWKPVALPTSFKRSRLTESFCNFMYLFNCLPYTPYVDLRAKYSTAITIDVLGKVQVCTMTGLTRKHVDADRKHLVFQIYSCLAVRLTSNPSRWQLEDPVQERLPLSIQTSQHDIAFTPLGITRQGAVMAERTYKSCG
jgi:hypothetical protein